MKHNLEINKEILEMLSKEEKRQVELDCTDERTNHINS